ncbi:MAG: hypothetical protein CW338_12035 [Clostridiales bacterium]|nr:hypothetical protein [Clostridiales bacterium]
MKYERSAGAVVFTRQEKGVRYIIVREKSGFHSFPKGHIEAGETEMETAVREIREETGLEVSFISGFRITDEHTMREKPGVLKQTTYYLAEASGGRPSPRLNDVTEAGAYTFDEAFALFEHENLRQILTRADDCLRATLEDYPV